MGVLPFFSAHVVESVFAPIASELSTVVDCTYRYQSTVDFKTFMNKLADRDYDIAFIQPFDYVRIAVLKGYVPLVARNGVLRAVIVTRMDSEIRDLNDLKGKAIALPPEVAAISYLTRVALDNAGISPDDVTLLYTKNHGSCMHKVLIGKVAACGTAPSPLRLFDEKNHHKMKVIAQSPSIPHALFVVRDDISKETYQKLQQKLLNISLSINAQKLFDIKSNSQPFRVVEENEYDIVREYCKKLITFQQAELNKPC